MWPPWQHACMGPNCRLTHRPPVGQVSLNCHPIHGPPGDPDQPQLGQMVAAFIGRKVHQQGDSTR